MVKSFTSRCVNRVTRMANWFFWFSHPHIIDPDKIHLSRPWCCRGSTRSQQLLFGICIPWGWGAQHEKQDKGPFWGWGKFTEKQLGGCPNDTRVRSLKGLKKYRRSKRDRVKWYALWQDCNPACWAGMQVFLWNIWFRLILFILDSFWNQIFVLQCMPELLLYSIRICWFFFWENRCTCFCPRRSLNELKKACAIIGLQWRFLMSRKYLYHDTGSIAYAHIKFLILGEKENTDFTNLSTQLCRIPHNPALSRVILPVSVLSPEFPWVCI